MTLLQQGNKTNPSRDDEEVSDSPVDSGLAMRVHGGPHDGQIVRVSADKCTIGRSPKCTIRLVAAQFEPLHCLMVRGSGGVLVRSWGDATKLNGQPFSVSWMVPGDRLAMGSIELELLSQIRKDVSSQTESNPSESNPSEESSDELVRAQQRTEQLLEERKELLEERKELLERLDTLQADIEVTKAANSVTSSEWDAERQLLKDELEKVRADRDLVQRIVDELRDEVEEIVQLRHDWQHQREQLMLQLEVAQSAIEARASRPDDVSGEAGRGTFGPPPTDASPSSVEHGQSRDQEVGTPGRLASEAEDISAEARSFLKKYGLGGDAEEAGDEVLEDSEDGSATPAISMGDADGVQQAGAVVGAGALKPNEDTESSLRTASVRGIRLATRVNLSALRDVANTTARVAIDQHAHRRGLQEAFYKWMIGICAAMIGGFTAQMLRDNIVAGRILSGACWVMAIWWFFLGSLSYRRAALIDPRRQRRRSTDKPASAAS